jgi:hypothetical protein
MKTFPVPFAFFSTLRCENGELLASLTLIEGEGVWIFPENGQIQAAYFYESISFLVWSNLQAFGELKKRYVQTPINFTCSDALA